MFSFAIFTLKHLGVQSWALQTRCGGGGDVGFVGAAPCAPTPAVGLSSPLPKQEHLFLSKF